MTEFGDWLRVTTFCDCEEWCVNAKRAFATIPPVGEE